MNTGLPSGVFPIPTHENGRPAGQVYTQAKGKPPKAYKRYDEYYRNKKDLYTRIRHGLELRLTSEEDRAELRSSIKTLRTPIHRVVEFYATTMLIGTARQAFPISDATDGIRQAIYHMWRSSNLDVRKQVIKRLLAKHGHIFGKVNFEPGKRVWFTFMEARFVTDFKKDDRGNLIYIRIDVPYEDEDLLYSNPQNAKKVYTEIWRKGIGGKEGYCRTWIRDRDPSEDTLLHERAFDKGIEAGKVEQTANLRLTEAAVSNDPRKGATGYDFVPLTDCLAKDDGEKWPEPIYEHALPLVDELNKMGTRHHDLLFLYDKPHRAYTGIGHDPKTNRPYPAPEIRDYRTGGSFSGQGGPSSAPSTQMFAGEIAVLLDAGEKANDLSLDGEILMGLPGNVKAEDITPNVNYEAMLHAINSMAEELIQELPELNYFKTLDKAELSGRSLRLIMSGAVDRTIEMRGNIENMMVDLDNMGMSIGQLYGLPDFSKSKIGTYDEIDGFKHSFEEREVLEPSDLENEELRGRRIANAIALMQIGIEPERAFAEVGMGQIPLPPDLAQRLASMGVTVPSVAGDAQTGPGTAGTTSPATQGGGQLTGVDLDRTARALQQQLGGFGSSRRPNF